MICAIVPRAYKFENRYFAEFKINARQFDVALWQSCMVHFSGSPQAIYHADDDTQ